MFSSGKNNVRTFYKKVYFPLLMLTSEDIIIKFDTTFLINKYVCLKSFELTLLFTNHVLLWLNIQNLRRNIPKFVTKILKQPEVVKCAWHIFWSIFILHVPTPQLHNVILPNALNQI